MELAVAETSLHSATQQRRRSSVDSLLGSEQSQLYDAISYGCGGGALVLRVGVCRVFRTCLMSPGLTACRLMELAIGLVSVLI